MTPVGTSSETELVDPPFGENDLLHSVARAIGLQSGYRGQARIGVAIAILTWVPLVVLMVFERTFLDGPAIPGRYSFGTHTRLLLAIPLFFYAETLFSWRISEVRRRMLQAELVAPEDLTRFREAWRQASRWWNSWAVGLALGIVTFVSIYSGLRTDVLTGVSTWRTTADGRLTLAGWWYTLVCLPFFQFLLWRWGWRLVIWGRLLWRVSRLNLQLIPTHPDMAGGLGSLGVAHVDLAPLAFASAAIFAANSGEQMMFGGATLPQFAVPVVAAVVGQTAALIAPLLFFSGRLLDVKQRGLLEYGAFASSYTRAFEAKWLRAGAPPNEALLGTADLQSLADLGNSFSVIREMRIVPIAWRQIVLLAASSAVPLLPLLLIVFPLDELILRGAKSLIGA
jgi:hypothetical protein